ncbi:MAG: DUF222 domain-containing protein [Actinomycetota bacterium]|nr:DUF222 domain-containing protein [Actinomycetota bacterium]
MANTATTVERDASPWRGAPTPGMRARLDQVATLLSSVTSSLEPATLSGDDAIVLFRQLVHIERLAGGAKILLAGRIDKSGAWRSSGRRDAAEFLAETEGVTTGQARGTIDAGRALEDLPDVADAVRGGRLSGPQAQLVAGTAKEAPDREQELLDKATNGSLPDLKERCREVRAAQSAKDHLARARRIHAGRHFRSWTDHEGAFCFSGRALPEVGSKLLAAIQAEVARRRSAESATTGSQHGDGAQTPAHDPFHPIGDHGPAPAAAERPTYGARCLDALVALACGERSDGDGQPGAPSVVVRVDVEALRRGQLEPGEICHAEGVGPIPVPTLQALLSDATLRLIFMECERIVAVSTQTRTIPSALRAALLERDRTCVVPGCNVRHGLEIDHTIPFAEGGETSLQNLARLCHWHHYLKTYEGWRLRRLDDDPTGPGVRWQFEKPTDTSAPGSWP